MISLFFHTDFPILSRKRSDIAPETMKNWATFNCGSLLFTQVFHIFDILNVKMSCALRYNAQHILILNAVIHFHTFICFLF